MMNFISCFNEKYPDFYLFEKFHKSCGYYNFKTSLCVNSENAVISSDFRSSKQSKRGKSTNAIF